MPDTDPKSLPQVASELWELTKRYAQQETIDPMKGLARYVGFGIAGSLLLGAGVILLMLALLRALQTEFDQPFTGSLTWVPYAITLAVGALLAGLAASRIGKKGGRR